MARLNVTLSNVRVTHSAHAPAPPVHVLVRSPLAHASPLLSPAGVCQADGSVLLAGWRARWEEGAPTVQSVLQLSLQAVDRRSKWKRRRQSALSNPFGRSSAQRGPPVLGKTSLSLLSMACSTVRRSVRIFATGRDGERDGSFWDISFDAIVEEREDVQVILRDVAVCCPFPLRSAYVVVAVEGGPSRISVVGPEVHRHCADPAWRTIPTLTLPRMSLSRLSRTILTIRVHEAHDDNKCVGVLQLTLHDIWGSVVRTGYSTPFQGELQLPNAIPAAETVTVGSIRGLARLASVPRTGQMAEGIATHVGVTGGRPIYCGAALPVDDIIRGEVRDAEDLPAGWVQLYDTFGYRFFYNTASTRHSWVRPAVEDDSPDHDAQLAELGFERTRNNFYRSISTGAETWVHPAATCIPAVNYASASESEYSSFRPGMSTAASTPVFSQGPAPRSVSALSCSTLVLPQSSCPEPQTAVPAQLTTAQPVDKANTPSTPNSATAQLPPRTQSASSSALPLPPRSPRSPLGFAGEPEFALRPRVGREEKEEFCTEMKWIRLADRGDNQLIPGSRTEGHTLTSMHGGRTLLKFGGKGPDGKTNEVAAYDSYSMNWTQLHPLGVPPTPRYGHGAVSIGSDRSRLLVFGGSSRLGRLNDLHILHEENVAWSPVNASGEAPAVRSRLGMTATSAGDMALVFGGRSIYRFLGGTYYDSKNVHAFLADRSQWITMAPRGSGKGPSPRSGCVVEFINDRQMFVHGGYDDGDRFFADSWLFDLASCSWHRTPYPNEPTEPSARESHASTVVNGSVLIYGGEQERGGYASDLHMFDPDRLRWVDTPSVSGYSPVGLSGTALATVSDSSVILAGGDNGYSISREAYALDIARYPRADINHLKDQARGRDLADALCVVCLDARVDTMFLWCGHTVCCKSCSQKVSSTCPICRRPVNSVTDITDMYDIRQDVTV